MLPITYDAFMTKSLVRPFRLTLGAHLWGLHLVFQLHRPAASLQPLEILGGGGIGLFVVMSIA